MPTVDVNIFKAINPRWNYSIADAEELALRLAALGFPRPEIVCHPQGDGKGWGSTQELSLADLMQTGVSTSEPVHLLFWFPGRNDRQNCAQIDEDFQHGALVGYERLFGVLNEGLALTPGAWLLQLTRVPKVWAAITGVVSGLFRGETPPLSVRPPGGFNVTMPTPVAATAEAGETSGNIGAAGDAAAQETPARPTRPEGRNG